MKDFVVTAATSTTNSARPSWIMGAKNLLLPGWMPVSYPGKSSGLPNMELTEGEGARSPLVIIVAWLMDQLQPFTKDPQTLFNTLLVTLVSITVLVRLSQHQRQSPKKEEQTDNNTEKKPASHNRTVSPKKKFLSVFFCLRTSFWMSGPYFYAAYASKTTLTNGQPLSLIHI